MIRKLKPGTDAALSSARPYLPSDFERPERGVTRHHLKLARTVLERASLDHEGQVFGFWAGGAAGGVVDAMCGRLDSRMTAFNEVTARKKALESLVAAFEDEVRRQGVIPTAIAGANDRAHRITSAAARHYTSAIRTLFGHDE